MVIINLKELIVKKGAIEGKSIFYDDIKKATGIGTSTLSRIANKPSYNVKVEHIEKLCKYFECTPDQFMTIIPDMDPSKKLSS